ncbi:MAG: hypothetical protein QNK04_16240 [Myxococcota bacterium]|nr:hypothetical protein [Myxococcota bacterium]
MKRLLIVFPLVLFVTPVMAQRAFISSERDVARNPSGKQTRTHWSTWNVLGRHVPGERIKPPNSTSTLLTRIWALGQDFEGNRSHGGSYEGWEDPWKLQAKFGKTDIGHSRWSYNRAAEAQGGGIFTYLADCPAPGDCIMRADRVTAPAPATAAGDEGVTVQRMEVADYPRDLADGVLTASVRPGASSHDVDLESNGEARSIGENTLMVFEGVRNCDEGKPGCRVEQVKKVRFENPYWEVEGGGMDDALRSSVAGESWCFASDEARWKDHQSKDTGHGGSWSYEWLPVVAGPNENGCGWEAKATGFTGTCSEDDLVQCEGRPLTFRSFHASSRTVHFKRPLGSGTSLSGDESCRCRGGGTFTLASPVRKSTVANGGGCSENQFETRYYSQGRIFGAPEAGYVPNATWDVMDGYSGFNGRLAPCLRVTGHDPKLGEDGNESSRVKILTEPAPKWKRPPKLGDSFVIAYGGWAHDFKGIHMVLDIQRTPRFDAIRIANPRRARVGKLGTHLAGITSALSIGGAGYPEFAGQNNEGFFARTVLDANNQKSVADIRAPRAKIEDGAALVFRVDPRDRGGPNADNLRLAVVHTGENFWYANDDVKGLCLNDAEAESEMLVTCAKPDPDSRQGPGSPRRRRDKSAVRGQKTWLNEAMLEGTGDGLSFSNPSSGKEPNAALRVDIRSLPAKRNLAPADLILIEDAAAGHALRKVRIGRLASGLAGAGAPATLAAAAPVTRCIMLEAGDAVSPKAGGAEILAVDGEHFSYRVARFDGARDETLSWSFELPDDFAGSTARVSLSTLGAGAGCDAGAGACFVVDGASRGAGSPPWDAELEGRDAAVAASCRADDRRQAGPAVDFEHGMVAGERAIVTLTRDADGQSPLCEGSASLDEVRLFALRLCYETRGSDPVVAASR